MLGETCPIFLLSTKNPTCTGLGSNPVLRDKRSATMNLSHGMAIRVVVELLTSLSETVCLHDIDHDNGDSKVPET